MRYAVQHARLRYRVLLCVLKVPRFPRGRKAKALRRCCREGVHRVRTEDHVVSDVGLRLACPSQCSCIVDCTIVNTGDVLATGDPVEAVVFRTPSNKGALARRPTMRVAISLRLVGMEGHMTYRETKKILASVISYLNELRSAGVLEQGQSENAQRAVRLMQIGIRTRNNAKIEKGVNMLARVFLEHGLRLTERE